MTIPDFNFQEQRNKMIHYDLVSRDITDQRVLSAMTQIPRERFVLSVDLDEAYQDYPLGIKCGQTISQPYIVALMTQMLDLPARGHVLEIGTGSGYQTAILAATAPETEIYTIERHPELAKSAQTVLTSLGLTSRIQFHIGDGSLGWPDSSVCFDRIIVTAAAEKIPSNLKQQLSPDNGRMVIPVGSGEQYLYIIDRLGDQFIEQQSLAVRFVPLVNS